jgi:predicted nucleic acid-binding protein
MMTKAFIDSNVWLYRLLIDPKMNPEEEKLKRRIAIDLTQVSDRSIIISWGLTIGILSIGNVS